MKDCWVKKSNMAEEVRGDNTDNEYSNTGTVATARTRNELLCVERTAGGEKLTMSLDSGATASIMPLNTVKRYGFKIYKLRT